MGIPVSSPIKLTVESGVNTINITPSLLKEVSIHDVFNVNVS